MRGLRRLLVAALFFSPLCFAKSAASDDRRPINEALQWVRSPVRNTVEYDYVMTARVHLVFFWAGKDDVGGGYIRRAVASSDPHQEFFQVLFGSDPGKTPHAINRWGAGTEVAWHKSPVNLIDPQSDVTASAFFGFMKSSRGQSVSEMQKELKQEKEGGPHAFTGILSRVDSARAVSTVVPLESNVDYNLRQYDEAEPLMLERIQNSDRPVRSLPQNDCTRAAAFMATVTELIQASLDGVPVPQSRCYVHDAQENTLKLEKIERIAHLPVQVQTASKSPLLNVTYRDLLQLEFVSTHKVTGKQVTFAVLVGTTGSLRGVPIQIRYQPNWWFQVVLNLLPDNRARVNSTVALR